MRARLHVVEGRAGFLREGTHEICDAASTFQLLPATLEAIATLRSVLPRTPRKPSRPWKSRRTCRRTNARCTWNGRARRVAGEIPGITGLTWSRSPSPEVRLVTRIAVRRRSLEVSLRGTLVIVSLQHHVRSFFQANRWLLGHLVTRVLSQILEREAGWFSTCTPELACSRSRLRLGARLRRRGGRRSLERERPRRERGGLRRCDTVRRMAVEEFVHRDTSTAPGTVLSGFPLGQGSPVRRCQASWP